MMTDPIADMLARIRNAALARHERTRDAALASSRSSIAEILKAEGFVADVRESEGEDAQDADASCSSTAATAPAPSTASAASRRPGRRVYVGHDRHPARAAAAWASRSLSTSRGVMTDREARRAEGRRRAPLRGVVMTTAAQPRQRPDARSRASASARSPCRRASSVNVDGRKIDVKGPKGKLVARAAAERVDVEVEGQRASSSTPSAARAATRRAFQGLARALVASMVKGAAEGYEKLARARRHRLPRRGQGQDAQPRARLLAPGRASRCPTGITRRRSRPTRRARIAAS